MTVNPQNYIQLTDIEIKQKYKSTKNIPDNISIPIHEDGTIIPETPNLCIMDVNVKFNSENVFIYISHGKNREWIKKVFHNIRYYLKRMYNIHIKENNFDITCDYGLPHPCLDINALKKIFSISYTRPVIDGGDNLIKYEFVNGYLYINFDDEKLILTPNNNSTEKEIISDINKQLHNDITYELQNLNMKIFNPHKNIFDMSVLYPYFLTEKERKIEFWNTIANHIFTRDFINEPTPRLRLLCESMNCAGIKASIFWLELIATLDYEMPVIGDSVSYLSSLSDKDINEDSICWKNGRDKFDELYSKLVNVKEYNLNYDVNLIPNGDLIQIHANNAHQILAAKPILYGPVVSLSDKNIEHIEDYFWSASGWWLKIKAARPCGKLDNNFNKKEIKEYWVDKDKFIIADKIHLKSAVSITEEEMNKSMTYIKD